MISTWFPLSTASQAGQAERGRMIIDHIDGRQGVANDRKVILYVVDADATPTDRLHELILDPRRALDGSPLPTGLALEDMHGGFVFVTDGTRGLTSAGTNSC